MESIIWRLFGKKYLLGGAVAIYKALEGKRTLLVTIALCVTYAAKTLGLIPSDIADLLLAYLGGNGGVTLLEKFKRWDSAYNVQQYAAELRAAAAARLNEAGVAAPGTTPLPMDPQIQAEAAQIVEKLNAVRG